MRLLTMILAAFALATPAVAAQIATGPAGFDAAWKAAACGDKIVLSAGDYGPRVLAPKACAGKPVVIDAKAATTLTTWTVRRVSGLELRDAPLRNHAVTTAKGDVVWTAALTFEGSRLADGRPGDDCADIRVVRAKVAGPFRAVAGEAFQPGDGQGIAFTRCRSVGVYDSQLSGLKVGILFGLTTDAAAIGNACAYMRADCINFGLVWGGRAERNVCHATIITGDEHPDCIQAYSRPFYPNSWTPAPPTSDLALVDNDCTGQMQCYFFGNHVRTWADGVARDDGGFDRVIIDRNRATMGGGNAIRTGSVRGLTLRGNVVRTLAGAPYMANIVVMPPPASVGSGAALALATPADIRCGNTIAPFAGKPGLTEPAC